MSSLGFFLRDLREALENRLLSQKFPIHLAQIYATKKQTLW